jgi:hypothetical protein
MENSPGFLRLGNYLGITSEDNIPQLGHGKVAQDSWNKGVISDAIVWTIPHHRQRNNVGRWG